jgi:hypothetical protein
MWTLLKLISFVGLVFAVVAVTERASQGSLLTPLGGTLIIESPNGRDPGRFSNDRSPNDAERSPCTDRNEAVLRNIPVNDAEQAIALFQCYWESIVLSGLRDESQQKTLARTMTERVRTRKTLSGRLASYREIHHRVDDTLTPSERKTLILYGALADLDRTGECWVIESFAGCPCSEVAGYIDAKTGRLMFVWLMPEG